MAHERQARRAAQHHADAPAARGPELNPVENPGSRPGQALWQCMRDNRLSNRIVQSNEDILDHACAVWRRIVDQPWSIITIGQRDLAHGLQ